jgi:formylglycine-generating enzyme required for sulfatase activity
MNQVIRRDLMKNLAALLTALILAAAMGCDNGSASDPAESELRFQAAVENGKNRAVGTSWEPGDNIGIYMLERGGNAPTEVVNRQYRTVAGNGIFTPGNSGEDILLNRAVDFVAYYPHTRAMNGFLYPVDVSSNKQADPSAIDLLTTVERVPADQNTNPVDLRFKHRLSGAILTLIPGQNVQAGELAGLRAVITGQTLLGDYDVLRNTLSPSTAAGAVNQPIEFEMADNGQSGQALILPAEEGGTGRRIEITLSGTSETFPMRISDDKKFSSGVRYLFTIRVNRTSDGIVLEPDLTGTIIDDWDKEPEDLVDVYPEEDGMIRIPGGTFMMGSPDSEPQSHISEKPQHSVTVSSFLMGKYEVTQREYRTVMAGTNPSFHTGNDNLPVENISWYEAVAYCNARSALEGLTPPYTIRGTTINWNRSANGYRLPTEAEWEYACRAGTTAAYYTGESISTSQANYNNSVGQTAPVGSYDPNAWGLYDMAGNVYEWCWDWYGEYTSASQTDPQGPSAGTVRLVRGGGWRINGGVYLRSAYRFHSNSPSYRHDDVGIRLVRSGS